MIEKLLTLATTGGETILYLLIGLSLLSLAVALERFFTYRRHRLDLPAFTARLVERLNGGDTAGALEEAEALPAAEAQVVAEGLRNFHRRAVVATELMDSMRLRQQQGLVHQAADQPANAEVGQVHVPGVGLQVGQQRQGMAVPVQQGPQRLVAQTEIEIDFAGCPRSRGLNSHGAAPSRSPQSSLSSTL